MARIRGSLLLPSVLTAVSIALHISYEIIGCSEVGTAVCDMHSVGNVPLQFYAARDGIGF